MVDRSTTALLVDRFENVIAELQITDNEEGWFSGTVTFATFEPELAKSLAAYDEIVRDQILSSLDAATADVARFGICVIFPPDRTAHLTHVMHIDSLNNISFRITPIDRV